MTEQIVLNYWFPYIKRYLKIHNLIVTKENVVEAFDYHKRRIFHESTLKLSSKFPDKELLEDMIKLCSYKS